MVFIFSSVSEATPFLPATTPARALTALPGTFFAGASALELRSVVSLAWRVFPSFSEAFRLDCVVVRELESVLFSV